MAVLVRNETGNSWVFEGSGGRRQIAAGATELISEEEWGTVISSKRGPGLLNPIGVDPGTHSKVQFEYTTVGSGSEVLYAGYADQTALDTDAHWTIKRFAYTTLSAVNKVTQIQVIDNVKWTDRATLPWT